MNVTRTGEYFVLSYYNKRIMSNIVQAKSEMHSKAMVISNTVYYMRFYVLADMSTKIYCSAGDPLIRAA